MKLETDSRPAGIALDSRDWQTVRSSALFAEVDHRVLEGLCGHQHPISYAPRQLIFAQGDQAEGFYLVLDGWVKLFRLSPSGDEAIVGVFTRGESFAEAVFFLGGTYPASAEAASTLRLLRIDAGRFNEAIEAEPGLAATLLGSVVQHTERLFAEIASLKLMSTQRRLADFLVQQTVPGAATATVVLPYEKALLAARLGMTPESLSRALASLRKLGVTVMRDQVLMADVAGLAAYARPGKTARQG
ncbi:MAG TPA: Crp/Fnr family transcriptional regulator [Beijerinckiaceae bacterium]|nr:Crp/Fnr family transcriptional regulator [Beijerinckiaceae bacterium]